jgi:hypothetical protein
MDKITKFLLKLSIKERLHFLLVLHTIGFSFEDDFYLYPQKNAKDFMKKPDMDNWNKTFI